MTEKWVDVAVADDLRDGAARVAVLDDGKEVALFRVDGEFYVLDNYCDHMGGPLGEGALNGCIVSCPWHGWQFDVRTGGFAVNPKESVQAVYPVRVQNGRVQVRVLP